MMDISRLKKLATTISSLAKTQLKKIMYYLGYSESSHIKNDPTCLSKKKP